MRPTVRTAALCLSIGLSMSLAACKPKEAATTDSAAGAAAPAAGSSAAAAAPAPAAPALTDANIAAILDAANESDSAFGALAVRKAKNSEVKSFGRLMMGEHHALRQQGQQLVKKLNVTPTPPANFDLPDKQKAAMQDLDGKTGADFDKAYIDHEVAYHEQVLQTATTALGAAQNQELKDLIQKAAPVIQKHLDMAKSIQKKLSPAA